MAAHRPGKCPPRCLSPHQHSLPSISISSLALPTLYLTSISTPSPPVKLFICTRSVWFQAWHNDNCWCSCKASAKQMGWVYKGELQAAMSNIHDIFCRSAVHLYFTNYFILWIFWCLGPPIHLQICKLSFLFNHLNLLKNCHLQLEMRMDLDDEQVKAQGGIETWTYWWWPIWAKLVLLQLHLQALHLRYYSSNAWNFENRL